MWLKGLWHISPRRAWHRVAGALAGAGIPNVPAFVSIHSALISLWPLSAHVSVYSPRSLITLTEIESGYFTCTISVRFI